MGLMDFFSNQSGGQGATGGGLFGALGQLKEMKKDIVESTKRPKPGEYCPVACRIHDERCLECMAIQEQFKKSLQRLKRMEEFEELSYEQIQELALKNKPTKCRLCGAPFETEVCACSYCGTAYPDDMVDFEVPISKAGRSEMLAKQIQTVWDLFAKKELFVVECNKTLPGAKWSGKIMNYLSSSVGQAIEGMYVQNTSEIKTGAEHYGVSVSNYLHEVAKGSMKSPKSLIIEEQNRRMREESQRRNAELAAQQARRQSSSNSAMDYFARHAQYSSGPHYGNVPGSSCCGNCQYYLMGSNECGFNHFKHPSGASDYCGNYRSM